MSESLQSAFLESLEIDGIVTEYLMIAHVVNLDGSQGYYVKTSDSPPHSLMGLSCYLQTMYDDGYEDEGDFYN